MILLILALVLLLTCIETIKKILLKNNFQELHEYQKWNLKYGKYFVIRNDSSIIAFNIGEKHKKNLILFVHIVIHQDFI